MPRIGQQIGPFTLKKRISSSPTHSLFYASKPEGTRNLDAAAIQCINLDHQNQDSEQDQERNYQYLQALEHQNIPPLYQLYTGQFSLAREWVEGVTINELLRTQEIGKFDLNLATILDIVSQVASVLSFLHYQTPVLFHGRLNADHVLIGQEGQVYVIGMHHRRTDNIPSYSSPEQSAEAFIDWRTDLWALGALLVHLVIREPLYTGRSNRRKASSEGNAAHWVQRAYTRYPILKSFLVRTVNPAAGDRFSSMEQFLKALDTLKKKAPDASQRLIISQIAYDLHHDSSLHPPLVRKIEPPPFAAKDPSLDSLLPPDGPMIDDHEIEYTEIPEPKIPAPHIEHPEHTSPAIPQQATLIQEEEPELPDEEKTEALEAPYTPLQARNDTPDSYIPIDLEPNHRFTAIGLILCNALLLLYLIIKEL